MHESGTEFGHRCIKGQPVNTQPAGKGRRGGDHGGKAHAGKLGGADFAKGSRFVTGGGSADITRLRGLGNRVLGAIFNIRFGTRYSDLCYGFNVFWHRHVPVLGLDARSPAPAGGDGRLWGDGFEVET